MYTPVYEYCEIRDFHGSGCEDERIVGFDAADWYVSSDVSDTADRDSGFLWNTGADFSHLSKAVHIIFYPTCCRYTGQAKHTCMQNVWVDR